MKFISALLLFITTLVSCNPRNETNPVVNHSEYENFLLNPEKNEQVFFQTISFWQEKIDAQPGGFLYLQKLAVTYSEKFERSGEIEWLHMSDSLYELANELVSARSGISNNLSLSSNAIKQHNFQDALQYAYNSLEHADEKFGPSLMVFDAALELGYEEIAQQMLEAAKNPDSFDYLVRLSKYLDQQGNLDSAVVTMEKASGMVTGRRIPAATWALANLADMYGHQGKIRKSYDTYLKVLEKDPSYLHALKGIAWIAYSNDRNIEEARTLAIEILQRTSLPDMHLFLAELAEFEKDQQTKKRHIDSFIAEAERPVYGGMYAGYLIDICLERKEFDKATDIAKKEIENRATPMTYSLLASAYSASGQHFKAQEIIENHIEGFTHEPMAIYRMASIFAENGRRVKAEKYFRSLHDATFELGPVISGKINNYLAHY